MTIKSILSCIILSLVIIPDISGKSHKAAKKIKKEKPTYPVSGKLIKNMDESELIQVLQYAKAINDCELVYKSIFYIINQSTNPEIIKKYKLEFADYAFNVQDYPKALMAYEDFGVMFPGSDEFEYANYKAILCSFYLSLDFDRDQTSTQKTLSLCLLFLQKAKNQTFISEVRNIHTSCRQRLFDHEVYILETYLKQTKISSAQKRFEYIKQEFSDIKNYAEYVAYLETFIASIKDPQTRPFSIDIDLRNALKKDEVCTTTRPKKKMLSFLLG